jgi:hypothetical protein
MQLSSWPPPPREPNHSDLTRYAPTIPRNLQAYTSCTKQVNKQEAFRQQRLVKKCKHLSNFPTITLQALLFFHITQHIKLNIIVNWLTLLLHIREDPGSHLDPETGCPGFSWFSSVPPGECQDYTLKFGHDHILPNSLQFIIHLSPFHLMLQSLSYWETIAKWENYRQTMRRVA